MLALHLVFALSVDVTHVPVSLWHNEERKFIQCSKNSPKFEDTIMEIRRVFIDEIDPREGVLLMYLPREALYTDRDKRIKIVNDEDLRAALRLLLAGSAADPSPGFLYAFSSADGRSPDT